MHGRGPPCMPPGPRQASLIMLLLYAHHHDGPADWQNTESLSPHSHGSVAMGLRMNGECPTSGTADPLPCSMPMSLPYDERARGVSISTKCFKEMHEIGGSSLYEYQTAQGKAFLTIPLSLMSLCVWTPACTGSVTVRTIRPLTAKARTTLKQLQQPLVQPSSFSQEHISTVNNIRPGSLLLASLGDSKVNSKQHPAITGF